MYRNRASIISHSASTCLESGIFSLRGSKNTHIICGICFVVVRFLLANMFSNNLRFLSSLRWIQYSSKIVILFREAEFALSEKIFWINVSSKSHLQWEIDVGEKSRRGFILVRGLEMNFFAWHKKLIESAFCVINFLILNRDGQTRTRVRFRHGLGHEILWTSDARSDPYISEKLGHGQTSETRVRSSLILKYSKPYYQLNAFANKWRMSPIFKCQQNWFHQFFL